MIILIDTDVLIDVALARRPYAESAAELLDAASRRAVSGFVAWHSISNFHYLVQPARTSLSTRAFILDLLGFVQVAATSTEGARYAARLPMRDFEDALQAAAAMACGADAIATRNVRDYVRGPVRAVTPAVLLRELAAQ